MAAGMFQGLQDAAAMKKRFERFGAVFFVAKVKTCWFFLIWNVKDICLNADCCEHEWPEKVTYCPL